MDCQFISIYDKFLTSQIASFSRADISRPQKKLKHYQSYYIQSSFIYVYMCIFRYKCPQKLQLRFQHENGWILRMYINAPIKYFLGFDTKLMIEATNDQKS